MADDVPSSVSNKRPDPEIARNAVEGLHHELPYSSEFIKVTIEGGWLTLEGNIEWSYQCDRAAKAVLAVRDVVGVSDNLMRKPRVVATEINRQMEDAVQRNAPNGTKCASVEVEGSQATPKGPRSWALLDGFSVQRDPVHR